MKKLIFVLVVVGVVVSVLVFRLSLVQQLSPKLAKYYGIDVSRIEVGQLDIDKIVIPILVMQQKDGAVRTTIEMHDLVVDVDTYQAKVSSVSSTYVSVDIEETSDENLNENKQSVKDMIDLLPIFGISIERLEVKYNINNEELLRFEGKLSYAQNAVLNGVLSSQDKINLGIDLFVDESDIVVNVSQADNNNSVIDLNGDYHLDDGWLNGRLKGGLSFAAVNQFLQVFGVDQYVQEDMSTLNAKFELDLTRSAQNIMQSFAADLDVDSEFNISSKDLGVKKAQVDVSASCRVERLDAVTCLFKDPQRAAVVFYDSPAWLTDHLNNISDDYVFEVNPSDQLRVKLSSREILFAEVDGSAAIDIHSQSSRIRVEGTVSDVSFNGIVQDWQLDADYKLKFETSDVSAPAKVSRLLAKTKGKLSADEKQANIRIDEGFVINALNVAYDGNEAKNIRLKQLGDSQFLYRYEDSRIKADNLRFALTVNQLSNAEAEVELTSSPIHLHVKAIDYSSVNQRAIAQIDVNNISLTERGIPMKIYQINANVKLIANQFTFDGSAGLGEQKNKLTFYAAHDLLAGLGQGAISADAIILANNEIIASQIAESGFPLQFKGGNLDVDIDAVWNMNDAESEITVQMLADRVAGDYAQNQFSGFNTALVFVGQEGWSLKQAANISIDYFNVGIPVKDVSMRLERMEYGKQEKPSISLSDLSAGALDGSIYSEKIDIDLNQRENNFSLFMSSLSLEELIALNQTEDLVASGTLNGELPMRLINGELLIDGGWLRADENGGYIKYDRIEEVLAGNQNLQLVGQLLKDFQYNEMSAQVDLVSGGDLTLATKLHGRSPNAELNKQVNLNFNIDFNLWKFLESARLLTRIDQDISQQILSNQKQ